MEHTQVWYERPNELRHRAERLLEQGTAIIGKMSADEIARLIEELHASQGELLRQNAELSRIQAELEESRDKLSDLYDFVPVGYFTFDQDYLITDANHTATDLLGVDRDALVARAFTDFVAPGFEGIFVHNCARSVETRTIQTCPLKLVKDNGCEFYAQLDSFVVRDDKNGRRRIRISVTDVTERRRVIAEIARLAAIVESSDDAIIGKDLDNRITSWNRAAERIYGYSADEVRGKPISIILPPGDPDGAATILENLKRGERIDHFETVHMTRDGRRIHVSLTISPIQDTEGNIVGASKIARDITERKKAEEAMLEYQKRLRTQASQLSLAEERERRRIATDLHDNVIQGLALSMIKLDLFRESSNLAGNNLFDEATQTLSQAIEDMRNMTFDISSPTLYKLGLSAAVDELADDLICRQHSIDYEFYDDQQEKPLDDDVRVLLFQSIRELFINVIKHAAAGKVSVCIERVGESVCTIVSDDGVGFDVDHTDLTMRRTGGFGLFNIRERLDYIGGSMEIQSLPGQGSTFVLIAPLKRRSDI
ncbi:MAG: PAS domain S-box protein [Planctomycetes bacterium]|nr:PAS domain S-box protein [Planctomycetota bacterium]